MLKIAEKLNNSGVVYFQGQTGWNKARMKRIIEDRTYVGSEEYTAIISSKIAYLSGFFFVLFCWIFWVFSISILL